MKTHSSLFPAGRLFRRRPASLLVVVCGALLFSGCASIKQRFAKMKPEPPPPAKFELTPVEGLPPVDPALLQRPDTAFRLGPGDELEIEVLGDVDTRARTVIGPDGKIYFFLLPGVDVWGLTLAEARDKIAAEMNRFVRESQPISITLRAVQSQRIWMLGRLNRPGVYPIAGPITLLEAISQAGGPASATINTSISGNVIVGTDSRGAADEAGDLRRAFVIRDGSLVRVDFQRLLREGDMSQNIYLQANDVVYVPSAASNTVHVLGAVNAPSTIDYRGQMSLAEAVAKAGGAIITREAHLHQVAVVRGSLTQPRMAVVDLWAVQRGQAQDLALEPGDIVYVPHTPHRVLTRYANLILDTFARTIGVNEGAKAAGSNIGVGISVPAGTGGL